MNDQTTKRALPLLPLLALALACASPSGGGGGATGAPATDAAGRAGGADTGVSPADVAASAEPDEGAQGSDDAGAGPDTSGGSAVTDAGRAADVGEPPADVAVADAGGGEPLPSCAMGPFPDTLDPVTVPALAQAAYQLAKEIPEILACCKCYCGCDMSRGHTSLLSCYTDDHAVG